MSILQDVGLDRYDRDARLKPALFAVLPIVMVALAWTPRLWTEKTGIVALLTAFGVTFLLSRAARVSGRNVEKRLFDNGASLPSVTLLRWQDSAIDPHTKQRYHTFLSRCGHALPSIEEERADPAGADSRYRSASRWLLEQTRDREKFSLLREENIDYGFRRNLLGLKPAALMIALIALTINGAVFWAQTTWHTEDWVTFLILGFAILCAVSAWIALVKPKFVRDAATSYAIRLLAHCDHL